MAEPCPDCETDVFVAERPGSHRTRWVCHFCGARFGGGRAVSVEGEEVRG